MGGINPRPLQGHNVTAQNNLPPNWSLLWAFRASDISHRSLSTNIFGPKKSRSSTKPVAIPRTHLLPESFSSQASIAQGTAPTYSTARTHLLPNSVTSRSKGFGSSSLGLGLCF